MPTPLSESADAYLLRLPPEIDRLVRRYAKDRGLSLRDAITALLTSALASREVTDGAD